MGFVSVLQVVDVETLEVQVVETLLQLQLEELGMQAVHAFFDELVLRDSCLNELLHHLSLSNHGLGVLWHIAGFGGYEDLVTVDVVLLFEDVEHLADGPLRLHVAVVWSSVDVVHSTRQNTTLDGVVQVKICFVVWITHIRAYSERCHSELLIVAETPETVQVHVQRLHLAVLRHPVVLVSALCISEAG